MSDVRRCAVRGVLHLYPPAFRRRYAAEMLAVFDAGRRGGHSRAFLPDLLRSAALQWARSGSVRLRQPRVARVVVGSVLTGEYPQESEWLPAILLLQAFVFVVLTCTVLVVDGPQGHNHRTSGLPPITGSHR